MHWDKVLYRNSIFIDGNDSGDAVAIGTMD